MHVKRVLVPVDFSVHSLKALDYAVDFCKPFKARLTVLHVVEPISYAVPNFAGGAAAAMAGVLDELRRSGRERLARLERRYAKRGVALRALLQTGLAPQAIADTAERLKADLIVMATHGRTGLSHLLMGSVAERVVRSTSCPVLTVRAAAPALPPRRRAPRRKRTASVRAARR